MQALLIGNDPVKNGNIPVIVRNNTVLALIRAKTRYYGNKQ